MAGVLSAFMLLSQLTAVAEENTSENTSASAESAEQSKQTTPQIAEPKLTLSNELKATVINLGDFAAEKFGENFSKKLDTLIAYGTRAATGLKRLLRRLLKKECRDMSIST